MKFKAFLLSALTALTSCGDVSVDYTGAVHHCGGKTCGAGEACVSRSWVQLILVMPVVMRSEACEKATRSNDAASFPYTILLPGKDGQPDRMITRTQYAALPLWERFYRDGIPYTLDDLDAIFEQHERLRAGGG